MFGFLTAMVHHGLTDLLPSGPLRDSLPRRRALESRALRHHARGLGRWHPTPNGKTPPRVNDKKIVWTEMTGDRAFGVKVGYSSGLPIYLTDVERTLLDGIRMPEKCGGISKVLQAWRNAEGFNLDRLIEYTGPLRHPEPASESWLPRREAGPVPIRGSRSGGVDCRRGRLSKVAGQGAYSGTYSAEWNLSLNVPPSVLSLIESYES